MKTAVITGATSGLGIAVIEECLAQNCQVIALLRENSPSIQRLPKSDQLKIVHFSLDTMDTIKSLPWPCEDGVFYHFAWMGTSKKERMDPEVQQKNITFTLEAMRLAKRLNCRKFVGAGSQAEYGIHTMPKTTPQSPAAPNSAYGISKYAAGKLGAILAKQLELDFFWVRVFSVYGPYDIPGTMIQSSLERMKRGEHCSFTAGTHLWDYLYSTDAGKAFYSIGERATGNKVYCLGSGQARPLKEYICEMRDIVAPGLDLGLGEISYNEQNRAGICADITLLEEDTGWKPETDFQSGIKQILAQKS